MPMISTNYPHPMSVFPADKFISIVITSFCRPKYLQRCLSSLSEVADMPFEVIVNDDGSSNQSDILDVCREKTSSVILNNGLNMGLNEAANRAISIASSKYIVFATDDCWFTRPFMRDICRVLSAPWVGFCCIANDIEKFRHPCVDIGGTRFSPTNYLGGGITQAFRKTTWKEVGGWDLRTTSGQSDNVFLFKILKAGYWKAVLEGTNRVKCANFEEADTYIPTAPFMRGMDCALPKLFNMDRNEQVMMAHKRREACQFWTDGERTIDEGNGRSFYDDRENPLAGLNDINYWNNYFMEVFDGKVSHDPREINWEVASRHGQNKWLRDILNNCNLPSTQLGVF